MEETDLRSVFYVFFFSTIGILCRQMGIAYKVKPAYYGALFLIGALLGLMSTVIKHMSNPILPRCGPHCLQTIYIPLYFFESGFLVDVKDLTPKIFVFNFCILLPTWVLTAGAITIVGNYLFPYNLVPGTYAVLVMLSMTPDLQATRMFFAVRTSSVDPELVTLLEFEGLVCSSLVSFLFHCLITEDPNPIYLAALPFEMIVSILLGFAIGQVVTFWMKKSHHDIVIQTSISTAFIFITFSLTYRLSLAPGLAVLILSIVMMQSKPSISGRSIEFMQEFIEIFRFLMISILSVVVGMEVVTGLSGVIDFQAIYVSLIIYVISLIIRLFVVMSLKPIYGRYCFRDIHDSLMISTCNIRGPFNLAMSFAFIERQKQFRFSADTFFLLATFQIVLSFFVTTAMAALMMARLRRHTIDYEKLAMIYRCANALRDIKVSLIDVLKKMAFSADADWDIVEQRTKMKKRFLNHYGHQQFISDIAHMKTQSTEKRIRRDSIRVLLRTQKHYLGDQFEAGLLTSDTAQHLDEAITKSYANKSILSAKRVMEKMAPKMYLLTLHHELEEAMRQGQTRVRRQASWLLFLLTLFLSTWRLQAFVFSYSEHFDLAFFSIWIYHIIFTIGVIIVFFISVLRQKSVIFTWLLVTTAVLSSLEILTDLIFHQRYLFDLQIKLSASQTISLEKLVFIRYIEACFSAAALSSRIMTLAFCLPIVKKCLFDLVHSRLASSVYVQCEAGLSYMHITKDSLHQLPDCVLDAQLMHNMQQILHQELLSVGQYLGFLEILTPDILTALKTYIASRLILNSQSNFVTKLREEGFLDEGDVNKLHRVVQNQKRRLSHLPRVMQTPSIRLLLENLPGLEGPNVKASTLLKFGQRKHYKPGEVVLQQAQDPQGLFVILEGLIRIECRTIPSMHSDIPALGPVYYTSLNASNDSNHKVELSNFYSAGAVIGERTVLTNRPGHKTARCASNVKVLYIPLELIHQMMGGRPQWNASVSQLEENMWRVIAIRQASRLIQGSVTADYLMTRRKVYHLMENASLIFGIHGNALKLNVRQFMAVVLVHGSVWAVGKQYHYQGPCFIPHRISQLELVVDRAERTVLLVLPDMGDGEQEDRDWSFLRQRDFYLARELDDYDEMTPSSDSSDGIPHKRYRDTLAPAAEPKQ